MMKDALHVVHPRAAGLDIHKMEITATVGVCDGPGGSGLRDEVLFFALGRNGFPALI